jgi:molybdopterin/thiamine biosynthesis adenylyltransferase/rhodanese-related sulfurtransferase
MALFLGQNAPSVGRKNARSSRTEALPGVGAPGQDRLFAARIVVIGAGGLGSPVLQYLAASGVGTIGIVDFDLVDLTNLQRQVIHRTADVGEAKTLSASRAIRALNPEVEVIEHRVRLDRENALEVLRDYDVVVDASDNFPTRYLANDAASLLRLPYVWGSVLQFDGQVSVFWEGSPDGTSIDYRDLHPVSPDPDQVLSCAEGGVLGSLCGTIGSMMATEVIKIVVGLGTPLIGRVQNLDALTATWSEFTVRRAADRLPVVELMDYEAFCGVVSPDTAGAGATEIDAEQLRAAISAGAALIDVREPDEHAAGHIEGDRLIPLATLLADPEAVGPGPVVLYGATGVRSRRAARALADHGIEAASVRGGLTGVPPQLFTSASDS